MRLPERIQTRRHYQLAAFLSSSLIIAQLYFMGLTELIQQFWIIVAIILVSLATWLAGKVWNDKPRFKLQMIGRGLLVVAITMSLGGIICTLALVLHGGIGGNPLTMSELKSDLFWWELPQILLMGAVIVPIMGSLILCFTPWFLGIFVSLLFKQSVSTDVGDG